MREVCNLLSNRALSPLGEKQLPLCEEATNTGVPCLLYSCSDKDIPWNIYYRELPLFTQSLVPKYVSLDMPKTLRCSFLFTCLTVLISFFDFRTDRTKKSWCKIIRRHRGFLFLPATRRTVARANCHS